MSPGKHAALPVALFASAAFFAAGHAEAGQTEEVLSRMVEMDRAHVRTARLAEERAVGGDVLRMAKRIGRDHEFVTRLLLSFARAEGLEIPMGSRLRAAEEILLHELEGLGALEGFAFDAAYARSVVRHHEHDLVLLKGERDTAEPGFAALLDKVIPILEQHLEIAKAVSTRRERAVS